MKIYEFIIDFSHKKSKVYHAYRVNHLKQLVETWHVNGVTIVKVPFMVGKELCKRIWRYDIKPNWCQNYVIEFMN